MELLLIVLLIALNIGVMRFAVFIYQKAQKIHSSGKSIIKTGIAPRGSGVLHDGLTEDEEINKPAGCLFLLASYGWYAISIGALMIVFSLDILALVIIVKKISG